MDNEKINQIDKTIEEIKEKQKYSLTEKKKTLEEIHLDEEEKLKQEDLEREQLLDREINRINEMIKNSSPKWILDDFNEFICKKVDKEINREITEVKVTNGKHAKQLINILKKFSADESNNNYILLIWNINCRYVGFKNTINEEKILQLIKGWVFYSNTQVRYEDLKFTTLKNSLASKEAILLTIGIPIIIFLVILIFLYYL